jgi:hypothetical protein
MDIASRIDEVRQNVESAKKRSGRDEDVTIIAVTKTVDVERIQKAVDAGCRVLGENRVQEMMEKFDKIEGVEWHLIGHLQKNKVKYVVGKAKLIHSADSWELLEEINSRAEKLGIVQDVLLELNISGEITKYGLTTEKIPDIMSRIGELEHIRVRGFMTMAPKSENTEDVRPVFKRAREIFDSYPETDILSMGMSGDYVVAVEEGATCVRVGSFIFGSRI